MLWFNIYYDTELTLDDSGNVCIMHTFVVAHPSLPVILLVAIPNIIRPYCNTLIRPITAEGAAWSIGLSRLCAVQKWLSQLRCYMGCGPGWAQGTVC